jgi:hypothetical protein
MAGLLALPAGAQARIAMGAYVPGAEAHPGRIKAYGRRIGQQPLIVMSYKDWGNRPFEPRELGNVWKRGAVPMVTWEPWGASLKAIARGRYDRYVKAAARAAKRWGHPLFLRFAHEMNGEWYPWGTASSPGAYKRAWRHLVRVFRRVGAGNVRWIWVPYVNPHWKLSFVSRYPGDRWVDWVGLDGMNWGGGGSGWHSFAELFGGSYRTLRRISSAPMIFAEVASGDRGGSKARWISRALRRDLPRMRRVRAIMWWSSRDPRADMRVNSSGKALRALRRAARGRRYHSNRTLLLRTERLFSSWR